MKSKKFTGSILSILFLFLIMTFSGTLSVKAEGDEDPSSDIPEGVKVGYRASYMKVLTGYEIEHFGFLGGEFTRLVKVYDTKPCCTYTGSERDGCSAVLNCH